MKKLGITLGSIALFFVAGAFNFDYAEATGELSVETIQIPESADHYAGEHFGYALSSVLFLDKDSYAADQFHLGSSFTMFNGETDGELTTIYYPVFRGDKIEYLFSVTETEAGGYTSSISKFLANELNELKDDSNSEPVSFHVRNADVYYVQQGESELIFDAPEDIFNLRQRKVSGINDFKIDGKNTEIKDVTEEQEYKKRAKIKGPMGRSAVSTGSNYAMIDWKINETQTTFPWCAAYVTAAILSNKVDSRPALAHNVMYYNYPNNTKKEIEGFSVNQDQCVSFGRYKKTSPIRVGSTIAHSTIERDLRKGNAIYMGAAGYGDRNKTRHAFALYGWVDGLDNSYRTYYLWNPWWNYPMVVQGNTFPITIPVPGGQYVWDTTIYNW